MRDLLILYLVVGAACAAAVLRRADGPLRGALGSAAVTVVLWPLWAPFVLLTAAAPAAAPDRRATSPEASPPRPPSAAERRIDQALQGALEATARSGLDAVLSTADAQHIRRIATQVGDRLAELDRQLAPCEPDPRGSADRSETPATRGRTERAVAAARRRQRSLDRLRQLRDRDADALDELAELCEALRAELMLAHYGAAEELADLKTELWARLEGLTEVAGAERLSSSA